MVFLSKQRNVSTTENRIKIIKLQELARKRLEIERILIREDPEVFLKKVEEQKWREIQFKFGRDYNGPVKLE